MKNNYLLFILKAILIIVIAGCKKDKQVNYYPDCFAQLTGIADSTRVSCGNSILANISRHQLISVIINDANLDITTSCKTFDVAQYPNDITISYYSYDNNPDSVYFNFCSDIIFPPEYYGKKTEWTAISGSITMVVSKERKLRRECEEEYNTCVKLENIKFVKQNSTQDTTLASLVIKNATLGICIP